jgi:hypothetical protein
VSGDSENNSKGKSVSRDRKINREKNTAAAEREPIYWQRGENREIGRNIGRD